MSRWIAANQIFDGKHLRPDYAIQLSGGQVTDLKPTKDIPPGQINRHHNGILTPGFFDIQINGGGGVLLNTTPTPEGIATIAAAHRSFGTTALLPTVITDAPHVLEQAAEACLAAKDTPGVKGLHIEGPHISAARRGTHAANHVRPMDNVTLHIVRSLRDADLPVLITVAPEATTTVQINALCEMGAVVSIGHSDTTAKAAADAVTAGATCFTHLFNAMSPMLNRAPGVTGAAIASPAWCSIIADGIHVDPLMIALAIRARPVADRMIAVSDAMSTVGGPDVFDLYGQRVRLKDGGLINAEGSLAGAHLTLSVALQNLVGYGIQPETALRMCRHNPAQLMGLWDDMGLIGLPAADILALGSDLQLETVGVDVAAMPSEAI